MHLILLSGGSGKRLWPLSNDVRSKQFLQLLPGADGSLESMVSRVYGQICRTGGWDSVTVAAGDSQQDQLALHLGDQVNIVTEPSRRDTFPAISLACSFLWDRLGAGEEETVAVLPVDPFVDDSFFQAVKEMDELLANSAESLILLGARPTFPAEKFGYIVPSDPGARVSTVSSFKEKPSAEMAGKLLQQGALWNCGVFGFRLGYVLNTLRKKYGFADLSFKTIREQFADLSRISFDYEVVEKAADIRVIRYEGEWKDLGSWETLTEEMPLSVIGTAIMDESCENTHIINDLEISVVAMGLKNSVVAIGHDGILIADKGATHRLKEAVSGLVQRPMFEERRWGSYKVLDHTVYPNGVESLTKKLVLKPNGQISYQYHLHRREIWTIISGKGILYLDGAQREVEAGEVINIDENIRHGLKATERMEVIEVQLGNPLVEEDIIRLELDW